MFGFSQHEKELKLNNEYNAELKGLLIKINSAQSTRSVLSQMSGGNDNADRLHDIYCDFGYPDNLEFSNYWNMYRRFGPAAAVVNIPPNLSWLSPPTIESSPGVMKEVELLVQKNNLWNRLKGLDKRQRVGRYAGLFVQVADNKKPSEPVKSLSGPLSVVNLKPIYEGQLRVELTGQDVTQPDYGQPTLYSFEPSNDGSRNRDENTTIKIHPSRIIIAAEGADDGSIYGISALENIYNDLMDLRKICGAGGEGFYQNTRNAPVINAGKDFKSPSTTAEKEALEKEIDDFLGKWQRKFVSKGLEFNYPDVRLDQPKEFAENSWNNISAGSNISSSELRGAQTGVLAGDKDNKSTMVMIQSRRENFLTELVSDVINWFMLHNVIEAAPFEVIWDDLTSASDEEKLALGFKMSETNLNQFRSGGAPVYEESEIREISGFKPEDLPEDNETDEEDESEDDDNAGSDE